MWLVALCSYWAADLSSVHVTQERLSDAFAVVREYIEYPEYLGIYGNIRLQQRLLDVLTHSRTYASGTHTNTHNTNNLALRSKPFERPIRLSGNSYTCSNILPSLHGSYLASIRLKVKLEALRNIKQYIKQYSPLRFIRN